MSRIDIGRPSAEHFLHAGARRIHIVQSGLSSSIRGLEDELGTAFLPRTTRRVELSEAGQLA